MGESQEVPVEPHGVPGDLNGGGGEEKWRNGGEWGEGRDAQVYVHVVPYYSRTPLSGNRLGANPPIKGTILEIYLL